MVKTNTLFLFLSLFSLSCDPNKGVHEDFVGVLLPALHEAVKEDDIERVRRLLSAEKCSSEDFEGKSKSFLAQGVCSDVNLKHAVKGGGDKTALFYVKSLEMANLLVSQGADITVKDRDDSTSPFILRVIPRWQSFFWIRV